MRNSWLAAALVACWLLALPPALIAAESTEASKETPSASVAAGEGEGSNSGEGHDGEGHDGEGHEAHSDGQHGDGEHGDGEHAVDGHAETTPDPLAFDIDLAWWTLGVFLLMLAILSTVAWKPIMEGLEARENAIVSDLAAAEQKHEEAKALLEKHQAELAGAAEQVRELLEEARRDADATMAQAKADAKAEFEAERERAKRDIDQATDAAVRSLAERTAGLAIDLAGRVVKQDISAERQSEIVREALGRFANSDPSSN